MTNSSSLVVAAVSAGAGLFAGWVLRTLIKPSAIGSAGVLRRSRPSSIDTDDSDLSDLDEEPPISDAGQYKMVIVIRNDLKMGKGKIAAQSSHAACGSVRKLVRHNKPILRAWENCGQPKVVTKVEDEATLLALSKQAAEANLVTQLIRDAGRTQIAPGSLTALAVGPGPNHIVDKVTGKLKLL
ncbi:peptidyl-tRNA hydrolase 2, mitochondrial-like [Watersipora subatra]|uniref:peptidyl-tRNA hydrolase 2, mitochondrial-like n=1 Tax=Watersipora subatra TaxID=2589382 RepID=UPI00355C932B